MTDISILLAAAVDGAKADTGLFHFWNSLGSGTKDALIIFGAALLLTLILFIWAMFIRHPKRQSKAFGGGDRRERGFLVTDAERGKHRSRRRKHRHTKRRRNPTLAETGGLPPIRDENDPGNTGP
jgi:hypothetical protein